MKTATHLRNAYHSVVPPGRMRPNPGSTPALKRPGYSRLPLRGRSRERSHALNTGVHVQYAGHSVAPPGFERRRSDGATWRLVQTSMRKCRAAEKQKEKGILALHL